MADQIITFTRRSGAGAATTDEPATVPVTVTDLDGNPSVVSDAELRAARDQYRTAHPTFNFAHYVSTGSYADATTYDAALNATATPPPPAAGSATPPPPAAGSATPPPPAAGSATPPPPAASSEPSLRTGLRTGGAWSVFTRPGYVSRFGHGGFGFDVCGEYQNRTSDGRGVLGGVDLCVGGNLGLTGAHNSGMSGFTARVGVPFSYEVASGPTWAFELGANPGLTVGQIDSPADHHLTDADRARIGSNGTGRGGPVIPTDDRVGDSGYYAGGLTLHRTGWFLQPDLFLTALARVAPTDGSWRLRAGPWGQIGVGIGQVSGHNAGDDNISALGVSWGVGGLLAIDFGGSPVRASSASTAPDAVPSTAATLTQGSALSVPAPTGGWHSGDQVWMGADATHMTQMTDPAVPATGSDPYIIASDRLPAGSYVIEVRRNGQPVSRITATVNPQPATPPPQIESGLSVIAPSTTITRTTAQPGQPPSPLTIGRITPSANLPAGAQLIVKVDNATVGSPIPLTRSEARDITIPDAVVPGTTPTQYALAQGTPHTVQYIIQVPGAAGQPARVLESTPGPAFTIQPATPPTHFSAEPTMGQATYSNRTSAVATVVIPVTQVYASGVTISVGGRPMTAAEFPGSLVSGSNTVTLRNPDLHMRNNVDGATVGTYPVVITLPGGETRTVQLVITRPTGHTTTTTTTTLPGAGAR